MTGSDIVIVSEDIAMTDVIGQEVGVIGATMCDQTGLNQQPSGTCS